MSKAFFVAYLAVSMRMKKQETLIALSIAPCYFSCAAPNVGPRFLI